MSRRDVDARHGIEPVSSLLCCCVALMGSCGACAFGGDDGDNLQVDTAFRGESANQFGV